MDTTKEKVIKQEPEFVICGNNGGAEIAQDPFAESGCQIEIKEEFIEPHYEDFDVNEVTVVRLTDDDKDVKESKPTHLVHVENNYVVDEIDHDDYDDDDFNRENDFFSEFEDEPILSLTPITMLSECDVQPTTEPSKTKWKTKIINKSNDEIQNLKQTDEANEKNHETKDRRVKNVRKDNATKSNGQKVKKTLETKDKKPLRSKVKKAIESKSGAKKKGRPKSQEEHKCHICDRSYPYASLLKLHIRTHMTDKGHNCPLCSKSFARSDHCKQHINNVHKGEVVDGVVRKPSFERKCEVCCKVFHHSGNLRKHMTLHTGERPFTCDEPNCGRTFVLAQHLKSHQKLVHSDEKSFQCAQCGKLFNHSGNYKKHMRTHSGERPFKCFCGKAFAQTSNYQAHMRVHMNDKPFKCDETGCDRSFVQQINLTLHKRVHSGEKPFSCPTCQRTFRRKSQCISHSKVHNSIKFKCSHCTRQFTHQTHLRTHEKSHTEEPKFNCPECSKAFFYNHQLVAHLRLHTGERPYLCSYEFCGMRFTSSSQLKRHNKMQHQHDECIEPEEQPPQVCVVCNKLFRDKRLLANHMRIHSGVKPYKCEYCEKSFITQSDCKKHTRIHTGEKPYQCEICQKTFTFSNSYRIHMRNHNGEKPFLCTFCGKAFSCSSDRSKHVKTHSNKDA
ncbi:zinc finger protein 883-like [Contarinia nasturtii]|uniref:zinc finger protein 883-like n=1 Tax=Contarinia nasturtii TaxID=265458 RepID=UPI0012D49AC7|nr:zinc finger protein 883-like [Contarinia nasturtii]